MSIVPGAAECGCHVEILGDELHVFPCATSRSEEHYAALMKAARELCEREGIPFEVAE